MHRRGKENNKQKRNAELFYESFLDVTILSVFSVPLCFKMIGNTEAQRKQRGVILQRK
jgi:hypothetical protein